MEYIVYILKCKDGTYYTGVTTDMKRRLKEHNSEEKGAKYTKNRRPVKIAYTEPAVDRSAAQKREYEIRQLSRAQKIDLVAKQ